MRISRTTATLPDLECPGIKPVSRETCRKVDCVRSENLLMDGGSEISNKIDRLTPGLTAGGSFHSEDGTGDADDDDEDNAAPAASTDPKVQYIWRSEEMTACSASCLGGKNVFTATTFMVFTEARFPHIRRNTGVGDRVHQCEGWQCRESLSLQHR